MKKRILALLLCTALVFCALAQGAGALEDIYFVAVNDSVPLTLTTATDLIYSGALLYAPQAAFSVSTMGITVSHDKTAKTVTLFSREKRLIYDLAQGGCVDENGTIAEASAFVQSGIVYLPVGFSAIHFGMSASLLNSVEGYRILRFTNGSQVYDDTLFVQKADNLIRYRVSQYLAPQKPTQVAKPKPDPVPPAVEVPVKDPVEEKKPITVYLALCGIGSARANLGLLAQKSIPAAFFFTEEELQSDPEAVRAIRVAGYPVGLTADPGLEEPSPALAAANRALHSAAAAKTLFTLLTAAQENAAPGYRAIQRNRAVSAKTAADASGGSFLVVVNGSCAGALDTLSGDNVTFRLLRETSPF